MSNLTSIQPGLSARDMAGATAPIHGAAVQTPVAKPVPLFVNPSTQFDPTVGIMVISFHDDTGKLTSSIPSQRQLQAYHEHTATPPDEQAPLTPGTSPPVNGQTSTG
jgi:hypothetical protein